MRNPSPIVSEDSGLADMKRPFKHHCLFISKFSHLTLNQTNRCRSIEILYIFEILSYTRKYRKIS